MTETITTRVLLRRMADNLESLSGELRKAVIHVIENPNDVSVSSVREIAEAAGVHPNTMVRMARQLGFSGYDEFREPFRDEVRQGGTAFPDRARWLQSLAKGGKLQELYAAMAASAIENIEVSYAGTDAQQLQAAAEAICAAGRTAVLGLGIGNGLAQGFAYLTGMARPNIYAIPTAGSSAIDDVGRLGAGDALLVIGFRPYRAEIVAALQLALDQGVRVIGISDSPAAPIVTRAHIGFVAQSRTPQFFTSTIAVNAILETLVAFIVAEAPDEVIEQIEALHHRRFRLGIYLDGSET